MKQKLKNQYYAMLYQFICVPLLAFFSIMVYYKFIYTRISDINIFVQAIVTVILIILNLAIVYGIAYFVKKVFKMPLINHIVTGIVTIVGIAWINVYFATMESASCNVDNAFKCIENINNSKLAMTALITCITYFFLYLVIYKIVDKKETKGN